MQGTRKTTRFLACTLLSLLFVYQENSTKKRNFKKRPLAIFGLNFCYLYSQQNESGLIIFKHIWTPSQCNAQRINNNAHIDFMIEKK